MTEPETDKEIPWIQRLYDRIWLIGLVALVFWFLSYVLWGLVDTMMIPEG
ncbi:MAG: hypothetical protein U5J64_06270 [Halobacteriales archaeon]|nr:hypothetical protein [Halobacteriales archaeon]